MKTRDLKTQSPAKPVTGKKPIKNFFVKSWIKCTGDYPEDGMLLNLEVMDNKKLSLEAKGLYPSLHNFHLLKKFKDGVFSLDVLQQYGTESKAKLKKFLKELEDQQYLFPIIHEPTKTKGYILTQKQETKESLQEYIDKRIPEWRFL